MKAALDFIAKLIEEHGLVKAVGIVAILAALGFVGYTAWLNLRPLGPKPEINCLGYGIRIVRPAAGFLDPWDEVVVEGVYAQRPTRDKLVAYTAVLDMDSIYPQQELAFRARDHTWSSRVELPEYMSRTRILVLVSLNHGNSPLDRFWRMYHETGEMVPISRWLDEETAICDSVIVTKERRGLDRRYLDEAE